MTGRPSKNQPWESGRSSKAHFTGNSANNNNDRSTDHWSDDQFNVQNNGFDGRFSNYFTCPIQIPTNWEYQFFSKPWDERSAGWTGQNLPNLNVPPQHSWQMNNSFGFKDRYRIENRHSLLPLPNLQQNHKLGRTPPVVSPHSSKQSDQRHLVREVNGRRGGLQRKGVKHNKRAQSPLLGSEEARKKEIAQAADKLKLCLMSFKDRKSEVLEGLLSKEDDKKKEEKSSSALMDNGSFVPELQLTPKDLRDIGKVNIPSAAIDPQGNDLVEPNADIPLETSDVMIVSESYGRTVLDTVELDDSDDGIDDDLYNCDRNEAIELSDTELQDLQAVRSELSHLAKGASHSGVQPEITVPVSSHVGYSQRDMGSSLSLPDLDFCSLRLKEDLINSITTNDSSHSLCGNPIRIKMESALDNPSSLSLVENMVDLDHEPFSDDVQHVSQVLPRRTRYNSETCHNSLMASKSSVADCASSGASGRLRARSASFNAPETLTDVRRNKPGSDGQVTKLKDNVMRQLLNMSKSRLKDIVTNPRSRKLEFVMKHLMKEHHTLLSRRLRLLAQARIRGLQGSERREDDIEDQENYPLDPDLDINLSMLPMEVIEQLGNIFNIDFRDCVDSTDSYEKSNLNFGEGDSVSEGLAELEALQEVLCAENDIHGTSEKDIVVNSNHFNSSGLCSEEVDVRIKTRFEMDGTGVFEKEILKEDLRTQRKAYEGSEEEGSTTPILEPHSFVKDVDGIVTRMEEAQDKSVVPGSSISTSEGAQGNMQLHCSSSFSSAGLESQLPGIGKDGMNQTDSDVQCSNLQLLGYSGTSNGEGKNAFILELKNRHTQQQLLTHDQDLGFSTDTQAVPMELDEAMRQVPESENCGSSCPEDDVAIRTSSERLVEGVIRDLESHTSTCGNVSPVGDYPGRRENLKESSSAAETGNILLNSGNNHRNSFICTPSRQPLKRPRDLVDERQSSCNGSSGLDACTQTQFSDENDYGDVQKALRMLERSSRCPPQLMFVLKQHLLDDSIPERNCDRIAPIAQKQWCGPSRTSRVGMINNSWQKGHCAKQRTNMISKSPIVQNMSIETESPSVSRVTEAQSNSCQVILAHMFDIHKEMNRLMKLHSQLSEQLQVATSYSSFLNCTNIERTNSHSASSRGRLDIINENSNVSDMEISSELNLSCEDSHNQSSDYTLIASDSPVIVENSEKSDTEVLIADSAARQIDCVSRSHCSSLDVDTISTNSLKPHTNSVTYALNEPKQQEDSEAGSNHLTSDTSQIVEQDECVPICMTNDKGHLDGKSDETFNSGTFNVVSSPKHGSEKFDSKSDDSCSSPSSISTRRNSRLNKSLSSRRRSRTDVDYRPFFSDSAQNKIIPSRDVNCRRTRRSSRQDGSVSPSDGESEYCRSESSVERNINPLVKIEKDSGVCAESESLKYNSLTTRSALSHQVMAETSHSDIGTKTGTRSKKLDSSLCSNINPFHDLHSSPCIETKISEGNELVVCSGTGNVESEIQPESPQSHENTHQPRYGRSSSAAKRVSPEKVIVIKQEPTDKVGDSCNNSVNSVCIDEIKKETKVKIEPDSENGATTGKMCEDNVAIGMNSQKMRHRLRKMVRNSNVESNNSINVLALKKGRCRQKEIGSNSSENFQNDLANHPDNQAIDNQSNIFNDSNKSSLYELSSDDTHGSDEVSTKPNRRKRKRENSVKSDYVIHSDTTEVRWKKSTRFQQDADEPRQFHLDTFKPLEEVSNSDSSSSKKRTRYNDNDMSIKHSFPNLKKCCVLLKRLDVVPDHDIHVPQAITEEKSPESCKIDDGCSNSELYERNNKLHGATCEIQDGNISNRRSVSSPKNNMPISKIFEMLKSENASSPAHSDPTQEIESQLALLDEMSSHLAEHSDSQDDLGILEEDVVLSSSEKEEDLLETKSLHQDVEPVNDQKTGAFFTNVLLDESSASTFVSESSVVSEGEQVPMKTPGDGSGWISSSPDDFDRDSSSSCEILLEESESNNSDRFTSKRSSRKHKQCRKSEVPEQMTFDSHMGSVLDLKTFGRHLLAACEDGKVYCYSLKSGRLKHIYEGHDDKVICLLVLGNPENELQENAGTVESGLIFTGSLDNHLRCFDFKTGSLVTKAVNVGSPVQCMDQNWETIFVGTRTGNVAKFFTKKFRLADSQLDCSRSSIAALKATREGPRNVLIVATNNEGVTVRDSSTGLLLRSFELPHTVFSLILDTSYVYCGTKTGQIVKLPFTTGEEECMFKSGNGVSCLKVYNNLLFAGCYDGYIYVYNIQDQTLITRIESGKMMLCLDVVKNRIIAGSKSKLQASVFPMEVRTFLKEAKHRSPHGVNNSK